MNSAQHICLWLVCSLGVTAATVFAPSWETGFIFKAFWVSSFAAVVLEVVSPNHDDA
jgi:hypothetical protein